MSDSVSRQSVSSVSCCSKNSPSLNSWMPFRNIAGGSPPQSSAAYGPLRRFLTFGKIGASGASGASSVASTSDSTRTRSASGIGHRLRPIALVRLAVLLDDLQQDSRQRERHIFGHD